jgi:hypothetical protein
MSTSDGTLYNSARVNQRNIVFTLGFLGTPLIESTRQLSYKYFPIKKQVKLLFETDNRLCETYGYVESNEPSIFTKDETAVISVVCPNPYFYSTLINTTQFAGVTPSFEFPFSNESLTSKLIEFGQISTQTEQNVVYTGDAEIGVTIVIHALGTATNIKIQNMNTRESLTIDTTKLASLTRSGIVVGDDIVISTVKGSKYMILVRGGKIINILNCLDRDADWFQLSRGDNLFVYSASSGISNLKFRVDNQTVYEGI